MLYLDAKSLNQVEAEITRLVSTLPPGMRVVAALGDSASQRLDGLIHVASGACLGRCWDYGNYEPASRAFRVRVSGPNHVVTDSTRTMADIESGKHVVTTQEAPLYSVCLTKGTETQLELRRMGAGETTCRDSIPATKHF